MANINVLIKLAEARKMFAANPPKKTGHNDEKNYDFFQLEDIVPSKNDIFYSLKLLDLVTFDKEKAYLQLTDMESEESITFTSPMPNNLKSIQPNEIQAIGSIETYQRRYLYITALDVIEADPVDTFNKKADDQTQPKAKGTETENTTKSNSNNTAAGNNTTTPKATTTATANKTNSSKKEENVVSVEEDLPMVEVTEADINSLPDPEEETEVTEKKPVSSAPSQQQIDLSNNTAVETKVPTPAPKKETHNAEGESLFDILSFNDRFSPDEPVEDLMQKMDKDYIIGYKIPIGKYKGQPLSDLSYKLCNWYAENYHGKDNRLIAVATLLSEVKKGA